MDLSKGFDGLMGSWPMRVAGSMVVQSAEPFRQRVFGPRLTREKIEEQKMDILRRKAEIGVADALRGREEGDTHLGQWGAAMAIQAVAAAYDQPNDLVTQEAVTNTVALLSPEEVTGNQFIAPPVAEKVATIINESRQGQSRQTT